MTTNRGGTTNLADWPAGNICLDLTKGGPVKVQTGAYRELGRITLPKGASFQLAAAIRLPDRCWARWRFARIGWGADPDGHDETGCDPLLPAPDCKATSYEPKSHVLRGGGPVAFEIKVYGPSSTIALPTVKLMAELVQA